MKRVRVHLNVGVSLEVEPTDEQSVIEELEEYITTQIGLDFMPLDVWCEVDDVEDIDAELQYRGYTQ